MFETPPTCYVYICSSRAHNSALGAEKRWGNISFSDSHVPGRTYVYCLPRSRASRCLSSKMRLAPAGAGRAGPKSAACILASRKEHSIQFGPKGKWVERKDVEARKEGQGRGSQGSVGTILAHCLGNNRSSDKKRQQEKVGVWTTSAMRARALRPRPPSPAARPNRSQSPLSQDATTSDVCRGQAEPVAARGAS